MSKRALLEYVQSLPDDVEEAVEAVADTDAVATEAPAEEGASEPGGAVGTETTLEPDVVETTEVHGAPIDSDITVVTPNDLIEESQDYRFGEMTNRISIAENAIKDILVQIAGLKVNFETIETAIDMAAEVSPEAYTIDSLINQL